MRPCAAFLACLLLPGCLPAAYAESDDCPAQFETPRPGSESNLTNLLLKANRGDAEAQGCLGELHLLGWSVEPDEARAWELFNQAAQGGSATAMHNIAAMYEEGIHVERDPGQAMRWHLRSAQLGYGPAQSDVGLYLEDGLAGERNLAEALVWYRKAAAQGEPFAVEAVRRLSDEGLN